MSEEVEIEFKNLLSKREYQALVNLFQVKPSDFFTQTNYYFDTENGDLRKQNIGLRIRILDQSAELTLKSPVKVGLLETTDELTLSQVFQCLETKQIYSQGQVAKKIAEFNVNIAELCLTGSLKTKRFEKKLETNLLVLDENWYGENHDYELELEVLDKEKGWDFFLNFLTVHKIKKRATQNKIQRVLSS